MSVGKITRTLLVGLLAVAGLALIACNLFGALTPDDAPLPQSDFAVTEPALKPLTAEQERKAKNLLIGTLYIPRLGVEARIIESDVDAGQLILPWHTDVAHASSSAALDAAEGTTLLAGHVRGAGEWGALHELATLEAGDSFFYRSTAGVLRRFAVNRMQTVIKADLPGDLWSPTGPRRAALVTCGGAVEVREDGSRHFEDNVIVTGTPVSS